MTRREYETQATLTDKQRQFRRDYYNKYQSNRRKLNIVGGILSAVATIKALPLLHINPAQTLTDSDKLKAVTVFALCLILWRFIRQQIQKTFTPTEYYDSEVADEIEKLTPSEARQILKEDKERFDSYQKDKGRANLTHIFLIALSVIGVYFCIKGGIL